MAGRVAVGHWLVRYWEKVAIPPPQRRRAQCWIWTAAPNEKGYGYFRLEGRVVKAHRVAVALRSMGVEPGAMPEHVTPAALRDVMDLLPDIHHKCEVEPCCNPAHLQPKRKKDHDAYEALMRGARR